MLKRFLCVIIFTQLMLNYSGLLAQKKRINIEFGDSLKFYAVTMRNDTSLANKLLGEFVKNGSTSSTSDIMIMAAKRLLNSKYVAGTLEGEKEQLSIFLSETDCILFVETCFNLALCSKQFNEEADFEKFANLVRLSRYRNGVVERYSDRIHYTTEWIRQGENRGVLKDITKELGGEIYNHPIYYMTKNSNRYSQLKDTAEVRRIGQIEKTLNKTPFYYIPQSKIKSIQKKIKNGDIICFMSNVKGLDIAHVAIAYVEGARVGFIHASITEKKVVVDKKTIFEYVLANKHISGIKVVRPN